MILWRICSSRYRKKSISGEGARQVGGRWNYPGLPVVYTSESLSLCALEFFANVDRDLIPKDLIRVKIYVPEKSSLNIVEISQLPKNWKNFPSPSRLKKLGSKWLETKESLLLKVPSALIPEEYNFLINPLHKEFSKVEVVNIKPFNFDSRLL